MLTAGARPLDYETTDLFGKPHRLHDFRRKAHVVLLCDPDASPERRARWTERRAAEGQRWTWLQAEALIPTGRPAEIEPGIYLISRWGHVIAVHPAGDWDMDRIERDLLTFESQDCCDLSKAP
jgi:hypothetical protein